MVSFSLRGKCKEFGLKLLRYKCFRVIGVFGGVMVCEQFFV